MLKLFRNEQIVMCVYFILHIQLVKSDSLHQQRNCSNELEPLLNLVSDQGKRAVLIPEENQISLEHITPHFDVEPCNLHKYRINLDEQNHHHNSLCMSLPQTSLFSALERHVGFRRFINASIIIIIIMEEYLQNIYK